MSDDRSSFPDNLRYACGFFPSISAVCRKLGVNRQQFNSYLSGARYPSQFNLKKICDLLGVDEREIFRRNDEFISLFLGRRGERSLAPELIEAILKIEGVHEPANERLSKYQGFYACYYRSCSNPGFIIRAFVYIKKINNEFAIKTIEKLRLGAHEQDEKFSFRRIGRLFLNSSRLFIIDYESRMSYTPSMTIVFPAHRNKFRFLTGVRLDLSSAASQLPFAARVVYEHLGTEVDVRAELRSADMYPEDSDAIPAEVLKRIDNHIDDSASVLTAVD